jgi:hypothetical protein
MGEAPVDVPRVDVPEVPSDGGAMPGDVLPREATRTGDAVRIIEVDRSQGEVMRLEELGKSGPPPPARGVVLAEDTAPAAGEALAAPHTTGPGIIEVKSAGSSDEAQAEQQPATKRAKPATGGRRAPMLVHDRIRR